MTYLGYGKKCTTVLAVLLLCWVGLVFGAQADSPWKGELQLIAYGRYDAWPDMTPQLQAGIELPPALQDAINQWAREAWADWGVENPDLTDEDYAPAPYLQPCRNGQGIMHVNLWNNTALQSAQQTSDYFRHTCFDLQTGKTLTLADFFYDGFDYHSYINDCLMLPPNMSDLYYEYSRQPVDMDSVRSSFSGLNADEMNFSVTEYHGIIYLMFFFDTGDPYLYELYEGYFDDVALVVPLVHTFSPYGGCYTDLLQYTEVLLCGTLPAQMPTYLRMDLGDAAFEEQFRWVQEEITRLVAEDTLPENGHASLHVEQFGDLMRMQFHVDTNVHEPFLRGYYFGLFDCHTADRSAWEAIVWPYVTQAQRGSQLICVMRIVDDYYIRLKEPSGIYVNVPLSTEEYLELKSQQYTLEDQYDIINEVERYDLPDTREMDDNDGRGTHLPDGVFRLCAGNYGLCV